MRPSIPINVTVIVSIITITIIISGGGSSSAPAPLPLRRRAVELQALHARVIDDVSRAAGLEEECGRGLEPEAGCVSVCGCSLVE